MPHGEGMADGLEGKIGRWMKEALDIITERRGFVRV
jgi:hypothetical protein